MDLDKDKSTSVSALINEMKFTFLKDCANEYHREEEDGSDSNEDYKSSSTERPRELAKRRKSRSNKNRKISKINLTDLAKGEKPEDKLKCFNKSRDRGCQCNILNKTAILNIIIRNSRSNTLSRKRAKLNLSTKKSTSASAARPTDKLTPGARSSGFNFYGTSSRAGDFSKTLKNFSKVIGDITEVDKCNSRRRKNRGSSISPRPPSEAEIFIEVGSEESVGESCVGECGGRSLGRMSGGSSGERFISDEECPTASRFHAPRSREERTLRNVSTWCKCGNCNGAKNCRLTPGIINPRTRSCSPVISRSTAARGANGRNGQVRSLSRSRHEKRNHRGEEMSIRKGMFSLSEGRSRGSLNFPGKRLFLQNKRGWRDLQPRRGCSCHERSSRDESGVTSSEGGGVESCELLARRSANARANVLAGGSAGCCCCCSDWTNEPPRGEKLCQLTNTPRHRVWLNCPSRTRRADTSQDSHEYYECPPDFPYHSTPLRRSLSEISGFSESAYPFQGRGILGSHEKTDFNGDYTGTSHLENIKNHRRHPSRAFSHLSRGRHYVTGRGSRDFPENPRPSVASEYPKDRNHVRQNPEYVLPEVRYSNVNSSEKSAEADLEPDEVLRKNDESPRSSERLYPKKSSGTWWFRHQNPRNSRDESRVNGQNPRSKRADSNNEVKVNEEDTRDQTWTCTNKRCVNYDARNYPRVSSNSASESERTEDLQRGVCAAPTSGSGQWAQTGEHRSRITNAFKKLGRVLKGTEGEVEQRDASTRTFRGRTSSSDKEFSFEVKTLRRGSTSRNEGTANCGSSVGTSISRSELLERAVDSSETRGCSSGFPESPRCGCPCDFSNRRRNHVDVAPRRCPAENEDDDPVRKLESFCEKVKAIDKSISLKPRKAQGHSIIETRIDLREGVPREDSWKSWEDLKSWNPTGTSSPDLENVRVARPADSRGKASLGKILIFPPDGVQGPPLALYKNSSNVNCQVKGNVEHGFQYNVTYVQKFVSPVWRPLRKRVQRIPEQKHYCACTDYG